jgi:formylglycine-generating enzyme required for sulfatase activity
MMSHNNILFFILILCKVCVFGQNTKLVLEDKKISYDFVLITGSQMKIGQGNEIILDPYYIGTHEVDFPTFDQFFKDEFFTQNEEADAVTRPSPPYLDLTLGMGKDAGHPANSMQHYGALMFCRWLYKLTGEFYRLPTELEWQNACYLGETEKNIKTNIGWFEENSDDKYHKSASLSPNNLGIFDMLGNVAEWTLDQYDENFFKSLKNGDKNPYNKTTKKHPHTVKGGSYKDKAADTGCATRVGTDRVWNRRDPQVPKSTWWNIDAPFIGFRLVKPVNQPSKEEAEQFFKDYFKK